MPETNNDTAKKEVNIIIISDAAGDTAFNNATAAAAEFPDAKVNYRRYPFITDLDKLNETFEEIEKFFGFMLLAYDGLLFVFR